MVQLKNNISGSTDLFSVPINYKPKNTIMGYIIADFVNTGNGLLGNFYIYSATGKAELHSGILDTTVCGRYTFVGVYITM